MISKRTLLLSSLLLVGAIDVGRAAAQDSPAQADPIQSSEYVVAPAAGAPAPAPDYTYPSAPLVQDGPRFRFGFAGGGGGEFVDGLSAFLVGVDFRLGMQINDMIGVYVQPHMSFGSFGRGASRLAGTTGVFSVAAMVDLTLAERFFAGAGFGYGVINNPSGPMLALRGGFYPVVSRSEVAPRRKALSLSFEFRTTFIGLGPVVQVMGMIGYEAF